MIKIYLRQQKGALCQHEKESFDLQERHIKNNGLELTNKNSLFNSYTVDVFLFITAIISLAVMSIVMSIICKHAKLKSLVTSLALQQIRGAGANQEHVSIMQDIECTGNTQWYTTVTLGLVVLGIMIFIFINARKLKLFRGCLFSNAVKVIELKRKILLDIIEIDWKEVNMTLNGNK